MKYLGDFPTGAVIYIPFATYDKDDGSSITMTGLAVTDIEIYKNGSATQRASDAGYTLLDTDGIDFDGITGIHGFSVDTSDNTDAGFYAAGSEYWVVVSAVTVDAVTVNFIAATFSIERSGGALALLKNATYGLSALETIVDDLEGRLTATRAGYIDNLSAGAVALEATAQSILTDTGTTLDAALAVVDANVDAILVDTGTDGVLVAPVHRVANFDGTAQSGTVSQITLAAGASATDDIYRGQKISIYEGTGAGQTRGISAYNGTTKVAAVARNWTVAPDGTSKYRIEYDFGPRVNNALDVKVADNGLDLTAIPWNAAWDAEVQSEATDALNAYDPPTNTEMTTAFTEIKGATWSSGTDTLEYIRNKETDIETDTAEIGVAGAGLTALPAVTVGTNNDKTGYTLTADMRIKKNTALANFMFVMLNSTDHITPQTGLTVTATRSLDGAAFAACANAVTELSNGVYKISLAAGDLNADVVTFRFTATGADDRLITIVTQTE